MGKSKLEEELTKELEAVIEKLYAEIQETNEQKNKLITNIIKNKIKSLNESEKLKKEEERKTSQKSGRKPGSKISKTVKFLERVAEIPDDPKTLMEEFGYSSVNTVYNTMRRNAIYNRTEIVQAIQAKSRNIDLSKEEIDEQIAKEGNVTAEAVTRIREQEEINIFKQRAAEIPDEPETLMKEFRYKSIHYVRNLMKNNGIYSRAEIVQAIQEKSKNTDLSAEEINEQIAKEGNVTKEAVYRIGKQEKVNKFKQRAAEIPDDPKALMQEFGYPSVNVVYKNMMHNEIYTRTEIVQALHIKSQNTNLSEEKINEQVAKEGNVTLEAVIRIREQEKVKQQERERKKQKEAEKRRIKEREKKKLQLEQKQQEKQELENKQAEQKNKELENEQVKQKEPEKDQAKQENQTLEKKQPKQETPQWQQESGNKEKETLPMEQKNNISKQDMKFNQEMQKIQYKRSQEESAKQKEIETFLKKAKEFTPMDSLSGSFRYIDIYDMTLLLRKYKIASSEDVKNLIKTTNMSDEEIAEKLNGTVEGVRKVRETIKRKQEVMAGLSKYKKEFIIRLLQQNVNVREISARTRESILAVEAVKEEYSKPVNSSNTTNKNSNFRKVEFKGSINMLRGIVNSLKSADQVKKAGIDLKIKKILVNFEDLLQTPDYALMAYAYLKSSDYLKAIEFSEEYLGMQDPTIPEITNKINEILNAEKSKQEEAKKVSTKSEIAIGED